VSDPDAFAFGPFRLLTARRELLAHGVPVALGQRAFEILLVLVRRRGHLVTKQELMSEVWPNVVVEENNLQVHVSALRKLLDAASEGERYLLTVAGRGYRFVAPVQPESFAGLAAASTALPGRDVAADVETAASRRRHNLPQPSTPLIGRDQDLEEIKSGLQRHRLVTLVGPGGIGKTRLAIEAGRRLLDHYSDGVTLAELASLGDARLVTLAIADILALDLGGEPLLGALATALQDRHCLLILDNCEHLVAEVARVAEVLIGGCPRLSILASSRERLAIPAECVFRVPPLSMPDPGEPLTAAKSRECTAVQLFVDRAAALGNGFLLTDRNASIVASICHRLDGIPLAIELAVPRLKVLGPQQLAAGLDERFRLLTTGSRTALERHQTLRALLDWSYDLLSEPERRLLRAMGTFAGGTTLQSIAAVVSDEEFPASTILDVLSSLVEKSLVVADVDSELPHYRLLETMRFYARDKAVEQRDPDLRARHARHFVDRLTEATSGWETMRTECWLVLYGGDIDNLRIALDWALGSTGDVTVGLELIGASHTIWCELGLMLEHRNWVERGLRLVDGSTPKAVVARLLSWQLGDVKDVDDPTDYNDAVLAASIYRELGDAFHQGQMLMRAGAARLSSEHSEDSERLLHEAHALLKQHGPTKTLARCLSALASARLFATDIAGAQALHERAVATSVACVSHSHFEGR
jgi:predicted ATPase/DNA-binding winged helix-turn-helix (wHTH) protein